VASVLFPFFTVTMARTAFSPAPASCVTAAPLPTLTTLPGRSPRGVGAPAPSNWGKVAAADPPRVPCHAGLAQWPLSDEAEDRGEMEREMQARRRSRSHPQQQQQDSRWPSDETTTEQHRHQFAGPLPPQQRGGWRPAFA